MGSNNRLGYAFAASLLFNGACVATVGTAALRHPKAPPHNTSELHPAPLQMAETKQSLSDTDAPGEKSGDEISESEGGMGKPGDSKAQGKERSQDKSKDRAAKSVASPESAEREMAQTEKRLEEKLKSGKPLTAGQKKQLARQMLALAPLQSQAAHSNPAMQEILNSLNSPAHQSTNSIGHNSQAASKPGVNSPSHPASSVVTHPSIPGKNGRVGNRGDSVSPKMLHYPRATLDLGTIHMTRPTHGVTGGGSADLRNVSIKVHYVVDDPNNKPKLLPNKVVKKYPSNCNGDPGNTAKCLPTGGNTKLGGTTLHGKHDQISGVKYCVPGGGGIPSPGSSDAQDDKQTASSPAAPAPSWLKGANSFQSDGAVSQTIHTLHLPAAHGDFHLLIPGAEVPKEDRKWVDNPKAHTDAAPPGVKLAALPRFHVSPRTVGSLSQFGTLNWGKPVKIRHKKAPYGGDGTGLLGTYYLGENFNRLVFTRPDRNIDFNWSAGPPDPRIPPSLVYSVRWIGKLVPKVSDTYTLSTDSDDGMRLYLDGKLLLSCWNIHAPSENTVTVPLQAGHAYAIKVEYYEDGFGLAAMKLYWEAPSVPREYIPEDCLRYPKMSAAQ